MTDPIEQVDPVEPEVWEPKKCSATNRQGKRCGKWAIPGGTVCVMHGGKAPQVKAKADSRLAELVPPAIQALQELIAGATPDIARLKAVEAVLDRAGYAITRKHELSVPDGEITFRIVDSDAGREENA